MGRWIVAMAAACCGLLGMVGTSAASVPLSNVVAQPLPPGSADTACPSLAAGSTPTADAAAAATHRDFCVAFHADTSADDLKGLTLSLPAGVIGDPGATPTCRPGDLHDQRRRLRHREPGRHVASSRDRSSARSPARSTTSSRTPGEPAGWASRSTEAWPPGPVRLRSAVTVRVADAGLDSRSPTTCPTRPPSSSRCRSTSPAWRSRCGAPRTTTHRWPSRSSRCPRAATCRRTTSLRRPPTAGRRPPAGDVQRRRSATRSRSPRRSRSARRARRPTRPARRRPSSSSPRLTPARRDNARRQAYLKRRAAAAGRPGAQPAAGQRPDPCTPEQFG